jgi:hypothetical protein
VAENVAVGRRRHVGVRQGHTGVAAEANRGTVRVEKRSERRALEKALDKNKASEIGYLEHAEDALCRCEVAGIA